MRFSPLFVRRPKTAAVIVILFFVVGASAAPTGFSRFAPGEVRVGGEIGHRFDLTVGKILHHTDVDNDFLRYFRNRVDGEGPEAERMENLTSKGGPFGGFVGYGMFLDGVVKACARGIGGEELLTFKRRALRDLVATQGDDGSISIFKSIPKGRICEPHSALWDCHESSYVLQTLAGEALATGDRAMLRAATRLADHMMEREEGLNLGCEAAFVMVYRASGDQRYLDWLERHLRIADGLEAYDKLVVINGVRHVYTAIARAAAQLDYAEATGSADARYRAPAFELMARLMGPYSSVSGSCTDNEQWSVVERGTGNWGETCATAYAMRLAKKLQCLDPSPRYGDYLERLMYNALFAAQSPDGVNCRYFVPFEERGEWWPRDTFCCPNNFRRWIFELADVVFLRSERGVAVNLYTDASLKTGGLSAEMKTRYPEDGAVEIVTESDRAIELLLRIPLWSAEPDAGRWRRLALPAGRQVTKLDLRPVERLVAGRGQQKGKAAFLRGPVVYGLDENGARVRFSDPARVRTYFVPPEGASVREDELFAVRKK